MPKATSEFLVFFIIASVFLMLLLVIFIVGVVYRYKQKQNIYYKDIETLKAAHKNTLLQAQLEMQEQTIQNISREIHDNIGQKLSLAKLQLNTIGYAHSEKPEVQVQDAVNMISEAINDLSDISKSMSSENILNNGFIKALEFEVIQLKKSRVYLVNLCTIGNPIFLNANTELVLFRIVQEAINNIIKHAFASKINIQLQYTNDHLTIDITDNGKGFIAENKSSGTGLLNMRKRAVMLNGTLTILSIPNNKTQITIKIPTNESSSNI
jgi:two-component system, NarL family, sensor kinase